MREPLAPNDAIWLQDSATNLMMINALIILDRLDLEELRRLFRTRVFEGPAAGRFERLRCRVSGRGRRRCWERDPDFDLARHLVPWGAGPRPGPEAIKSYLGQEASRNLDPAHPLWQIQLLEDFETDASAIMVRFHHSIGDGQALVLLLSELMDDRGEALNGMARSAGFAAARPSRPRRWLQAAGVPLLAPAVLLRRLTWIPDRSPMHGPPLSGTKQVAWTAPLDLDVVKQARRRTGATVNDVLMASVTGAFTAYLACHGRAAPSRYLVSMPVDVRPPGTLPSCENHFAAVPLALPAGNGPLPERILAVKAGMDRMKRAAVPLVVDGLQRALLAWLPEPVSRRLIDFLANKCTAVVTNLIGPGHSFTLAGRRVCSLVFWVPQRARIGLGVSILSFNGKVQLGLIADAALVPDLPNLAQAFEAQFEALKALLPEAGLQRPEGGVQLVRDRQVLPPAGPQAIPDPADGVGQDLLPQRKAVLLQDGAQGPAPGPEAFPGLLVADLADLEPGMEAEQIAEQPVLGGLRLEQHEVRAGIAEGGAFHPHGHP
jgi:WS/DGAT/MGAT family acyltransferase